MCGRATLTTPANVLAEQFGVAPIDIGPPRYNLAPSESLVLLRTEDGTRTMAKARWGLEPPWAPPRFGARCLQARAETVRTARAYRQAFRERRCLVVVDGFYEWGKPTEARPKRRPPYLVTRADQRPFVLAGLWERRVDDVGLLDTCAVVTTASRGLLEKIHDRAPLVLSPAAYDGWLLSDAEAGVLLDTGDDEALAALTATAVSPWVNDVRHDDPRCLEPAAPGAEPGQLRFSFAQRGP